MSFWAGVVQGVKDIDVLKEKEALADERQSVRAEEIAYRDRMDAVRAKQQEFADQRALEWRMEDQATAAERDAYQREQDRLAAEERAAAAAYRAKIDDRNFDWGVETFWIGEERTDESIATSMRQWDYKVAQDEANAALAATDRETDQERYDFQVERLGQLDLINAAAVEEDSRRYGIAQERLELLDIREAARIAKDDDRYAVAQSRIERLDAQEAARYDTAQTQLAEDRSVDRGLQILEMGGKAFSGALGGQGGDVNAGEVMPVAGMRAAVMGINAELEAAGGMGNLNDSDKEWFQTVLDNPAAAAGILAFAQAQRKEGNDLPITDLPKIIQLAGTIGAAGEEAYNDFKEQFAAGNVDMKDPEQFLVGMQALMQYRPAQVVWGQVQAITDTQTQNALFESWQLDTVMGARVALMNMEPGPEKTALAETINNASSTDKDNALNRQEAFISLWGEYGEASAEALGLTAENNKRMRQYFNIRGKSPIAEAAQNPTAPEAPMTPDTSGMGAPESTTSSMPGERGVTPLDSRPAINFGTQEEADAWYSTVGPEELSKIPSITISGKVYANTEYTGEGGTEPRTPSMPAEAGRTLNPQDEPAEGLGSLVPEQRDASPLSRIVYDFEEAKGAPLSPDEEIAVGVEAVVKSLSGVGMDPAELEDLVIELKGKFGEQRVQEALMLAMNQE